MCAETCAGRKQQAEQIRFLFLLLNNKQAHQHAGMNQSKLPSKSAALTPVSRTSSSRRCLDAAGLVVVAVLAWATPRPVATTASTCEPTLGVSLLPDSLAEVMPAVPTVTSFCLVSLVRVGVAEAITLVVDSTCKRQYSRVLTCLRQTECVGNGACHEACCKPESCNAMQPA